MGANTLCPGDWWIRTGDLTSPDMGNMYSNDLRCWLCAAPLVLAGVLHPVFRIAYFVLYHVVTFVLVVAIAEYEADKK